MLNGFLYSWQFRGNKVTKEKSATQGKFATPQDPLTRTANGGGLPAVPVEEGFKLNQLKSMVNRDFSEKTDSSEASTGANTPLGKDLNQNAQWDPSTSSRQPSQLFHGGEATLLNDVPSPRTNPLFPQLPLYGPASTLRSLQCFGFRISSFFLSLTFLGTIVLGSIFTSLPSLFRHIGLRLTFRNPHQQRLFHEEEEKRREEREDAVRAWKRLKGRPRGVSKTIDAHDEEKIHENQFEPTEGGKDALICDIGYYARRVGLDIEEFKVQTEDGFIIVLWHLYNPLEHTPAPASQRSSRTSEIFNTDPTRHNHVDGNIRSDARNGKRKFPVLLIHGLLQSAGAFCSNDDDSLAFFLCKR